MASSKVMASASPPNPDLPRQSPSSIHHHHHHSSSSATTSHHQHQHQHQHHQHLHQSPNDQSRSFGSMNMEEILKNIYSDSENFSAAAVADIGAGGGAADGGGKMGKTSDEVWREIVNGGVVAGGRGNREPEMTLEDFLTKAGAVAEEDVRIPVGVQPPSVAVAATATAGFGVETMMNAAAAVPFQPGMQHMQNVPPGGFGPTPAPLGFGNGVVTVRGGSSAAVGSVAVTGGGRGKRRAVEDVPLDKATQQKQRRMIKNRESAARSRERKQAERNKQRYKQLMENLIPVIEKRRPPRVLRRVRSMSW